jgi:hypothetical protein
MSYDAEIEIEILTPDKVWDYDEDQPDAGTVKMYNRDLGEFVSGDNSSAIDFASNERWIESI